MEKNYNKKETLEVADIFRLYGQNHRQCNTLSYAKIKVMRHIEACRTAKLGGHVEQCNRCGFQRNAYNSCRDRHCPKCQTLTKEQWLNLLRTPNGDLKVNSVLLPFCIHGPRLLWIISIFTA
jgi:predicted Zn-ribbon and HTH transcriptional regulator